MDRAWDLEVVGEAKLPIDLGVGIAVAVEVVLEVVPSPLPSPTPQRKPCQPAPLDSSSSSKSLQLCPTLCDPIDGSPPGSPVPRILQARTPEWVAISFSNTWKWKVKVKSLSRVRLLATPWTAAYQAPPSMGFSRQVYWSGAIAFSGTVRLVVGNCWCYALGKWLSIQETVNMGKYVSWV